MKRYLKVGERVCKVMPFSEACMFLRVADRPMVVEVTEGGSAQLFELNGDRFSFPVTLGEAGLYTDESGIYVMSDTVVESVVVAE